MSLPTFELIAFLFCLAAAWRSFKIRKMRLVHIIDGDTYVAIDLRGRKYRLRIARVDCPEIGQPMAQDARRFVMAWAGEAWLTVHLQGKDRYRRHLASIRKGHERLDNALVSAGLAYPLDRGLGLGLRSFGARVRGRGVWGLWFRTKPWVARRRNFKVLQTLRRWFR